MHGQQCPRGHQGSMYVPCVDTRCYDLCLNLNYCRANKAGASCGAELPDLQPRQQAAELDRNEMYSPATDAQSGVCVSATTVSN